MAIRDRRLRGGKTAESYIDSFDTLGARWNPIVGTVAVASGALKALTYDNFLNNKIINNEFTTNTESWTAYQSSLSRVDSKTDPGVSSGGADKYALKITSTGTWAAAYQTPSWLVGARYKLTARGYAPSSNTVVNACRLRISGTNLTQISAEDTWETLTTLWNATATNHGVNLTVGTQGSTVNGDIAYVDAISLFRQNTVIILSDWTSCNVSLVYDIINPGSGVVPFGAIVRYTDALNFWEIRQVPNTAGNDTYIVEVVDSVETIRASADVDWTASGTDQMKVILNGSLCTVYHKKSGAGEWTEACNYTMTTGLTSPSHGVIFYDTNVGRLTNFEATEL